MNLIILIIVLKGIGMETILSWWQRDSICFIRGDPSSGHFSVIRTFRENGNNCWEAASIFDKRKKNYSWIYLSFFVLRSVAIMCYSVNYFTRHNKSYSETLQLKEWERSISVSYGLLTLAVQAIVISLKPELESPVLFMPHKSPNDSLKQSLYFFAWNACVSLVACGPNNVVLSLLFTDSWQKQMCRM